jgi:hypothetical protein
MFKGQKVFPKPPRGFWKLLNAGTDSFLALFCSKKFPKPLSTRQNEFPAIFPDYTGSQFCQKPKKCPKPPGGFGNFFNLHTFEHFLLRKKLFKSV